MSNQDVIKKPALLLFAGISCIVVLMFIVPSCLEFTRIMRLKRNGVVAKGLITKTERSSSPHFLDTYKVYYEFQDDSKNGSILKGSSRVKKEDFERYELMPVVVVTFSGNNNRVSRVGEINEMTYFDIVSIYKVDLFYALGGIGLFLLAVLLFNIQKRERNDAI